MKLHVPDPVLTRAGFTLQGVLPWKTGEYSQLWVLGHAGRALWERAPLEGDDPLDTYSARVATDYLHGRGIDDFALLYPAADAQPDLIAMGRALGWHHDSPLGTGIHPEFGSWFAYRVVMAVSDVFEVPEMTPTTSPCEQCEEKPCLAACPVGATGLPFDLAACSTHRTTEDECAFRCLARDACPVGAQYRYGEEQMRYHYALSLDSIRRR